MSINSAEVAFLILITVRHGSALKKGNEMESRSNFVGSLALAVYLTACDGDANAASVAPNCSALTSSPIFEVTNPSTKANLLTSSESQAGNAPDTLFFASQTSATGLVGAHRMYNASTKDNFWTISSSEVASAAKNNGYVDQGVDFYVSSAAAGCTRPVYRFQSGAMHRFAVSDADQSALKASGWKSEGIVFYGGTPMPTGVPGNWTLMFDDEFAGTSLDTTKWAPYWFKSDCSGSKLNNVCASPANVSVNNGKLILTLSSNQLGAVVSTNPFGGAKPGYQFKTGVVEARILFPGTATKCYNWPAWWTDGQSWPYDGENDIAEVLGGILTFNYHSKSSNINFGAIGAQCGSWHIFTLNRQATYSEVYVDGRLVRKYSTNDTQNAQYLLLNVGLDSSRLMTGSAGALERRAIRLQRILRL